MPTHDNAPKPDDKPRRSANFMPWPFQAVLLALLAALGVAVVAD
ncbi:hypothetical protein PRN20_03690 [Devosia sp. ZB163]|nr:hypothetical protein [Devosia sp. ZB163]MDC9822825.1 hypothetical protein [Devosia sp. ZB163]